MTYYPIITLSKISKGYGYVIGGVGAAVVATVEKHDDLANTWTYVSSISNARFGNAGFSLNSYGYSTCGSNSASVTQNTTEKYDNILNTWTTKATQNFTKSDTTAFLLNGYGITSHADGVSGTKTEKYDDVLNTWSNKTNANINSTQLAGFSLNGYGYTAGGTDGAANDETEKYDDILDTWTTKDPISTATSGICGFSLNGYGYRTGGNTGGVSDTERYDDISNTWTAKTDLTSVSIFLSGFSMNGYGYVSQGENVGSAKILTTQKYDDILNTWTTKADKNYAAEKAPAFVIGNVSQSIQNPDIQEIIKHQNKETIPVDQTASRAIDGTVYTNTSSLNLFVTVSARCIIDTAADVANIQAFSDANANPVAAASGIVGIEGGLAGEDVSVEISFVVRPYEKYKVVKTTSAGCTATLGKWFETTMK